MIRCAFAIPGDLATPTGGYAYDREVMRRLAGQGIDVAHLALPGGFPDPSADERAATLKALAGLDASTVILADGLAYGAFDDRMLATIANPLVALVHHPLAHETGTPPSRAEALRASETSALARADAVVVTSRPTADLLVGEYAVPERKIAVAEPGVTAAARAAGSGRPAPALLAVGAVSPRKGYGVLIDALAALRESAWSLVIVGATDRNPAEAARLEGMIAQEGLADRVTLAGSLDEAALAKAYAAADLFVMPSLFEGYGMVITEALARGLPMVSTTGGALARVVPDAAALKVPPGDAPALAEALRAMIGDADLRRRKADAAWALAGALPRWDETAATIAQVIKEVAR